MRLLTPAALVLICFGACFGQNNLGQDVLVEVGDTNVILQCLDIPEGAGYRWLFVSSSDLTDTPVTVYDSSGTLPIADEYEEENDDDATGTPAVFSSRLTIKEIAVTGTETTGLYRCEHGDTPTLLGEAHVIAIEGGGATCSATPPAAGVGRNVDLTCSVTFQSHIGTPDTILFSWTQGTGSIDDELPPDDPEANPVTNTLTQTVTVEMNTDAIDCTAAYTITGSSSTAAPITCITPVTVDVIDVVPSQDFIEEVGEVVVITCKLSVNTDEAVWTFLAHDAEDEESPEIITNNGDYSIAEGDTDRDLTIEAVTVAQAGTYTCTVNEVPGGAQVDTGSAEVVVVPAADPICNLPPSVSAPDDMLSMTCTVTRSSHVGEEPGIEFQINQGTADDPDWVTVETPVTDGEGPGEYVGTAQQTARSLDTGFYRCVVSHVNTDPVPNRVTQWGTCDLSTTDLDVTYAPTTDFVEETNEEVVVPCSLSVGSDTAAWTFVPHDSTITEPISDGDEGYIIGNTGFDRSLTIEELAIDEAGSYTCRVIDANDNEVAEGSSEVVAVPAGDPTCVLPVLVGLPTDVLSMTCTVTRGSHVNEEPSIQWEINQGTDEDPNWVEVETPVVEGGEDGEYVGTATDTAVDIQASAYRCVVQHENTDATPNRLTEWGMCDLDKTGLDIVFTPRADFIQAAEDEVEIPCSLSADTDTAAWTFLVHDAATGATAVPISNDDDGYGISADGMDRTLTIESLAISQAGTYTCTVTDNDDAVVDQGSAVVVLVPADDPACALPVLQAAPLDDLDMTCTATRSSHQDEEPIIQWQIRTSDEGDWGDVDTDVDSGDSAGEYVGTASALAATIAGGEFRCVVQHQNTDDPNRETDWGGCTLDQSGLDIITGLVAPDDFRAEQGSDAAATHTLSCGLEEDADATVTWSFAPFNGEETIEISEDTDTWTLAAAADAEAQEVMELTIAPVQARYVGSDGQVTAGTYMCTIARDDNEENNINRQAVVGTYDAECNSSEEDREFTCEIWSTEDIDGVTIEFADGDNAVEDDVGPVTDSQPNDETNGFQSIYGPPIQTDVDEVVFTCTATAQVDGEPIAPGPFNCDAIGGSNQMKVSLLVLLGALLICAMRY